MEIKNIKLIYDINRDFPPKRVLVSHVNDVNTRVIELTLTEGGDALELGESSTAAASVVERRTKRLINSSIACTIDQNGKIIIPIDDLHLRSRMDINVEVTVYDSSNTKVLTLPYPLWIRVNPSVLDDAEVTDESRGTVPELLEEAREIIEGDRYVLTEADKQEIAGMVDISGKEDTIHKKSAISGQSQTGDSDTNYPTVGAVRDYTDGKVSELEGYVDDELDDMDTAKADKATTLSGYGITDGQTKIDSSHKLSSDLVDDTNKTNKFVTSSEKITWNGKYEKPGDGIPKTDLASAVQTSLGKADSALQSHQDISGKADKATTLAGYGITNAYTKAEVDNMLSADNVPSYVIEEAESVISKALSHTGLGRTVRFIAVSDAHNDATDASHDYTKTSNLHCGQAVKYIADRLGLDFAASLGDVTWAGVAHTTAQYNTDWLHADIRQMNGFIAEGFMVVPNIRVVGNHDQCATTKNGTSSRLQNSGAYQYFGRYNAGKNINPGGYGYYDLENVKLRVIYLNTSDTVSTSSDGTLLSVSSAQKDWLCETLIDLNTKSDASSWKILLLSHAPLDMIAGVGKPDTEQNHILIPYTNGGSYGAYSFTNHSAKIIGNCHGHTHCYNVGYISDRIRRFTIPNSNFYDNNHYGDNPSYDGWNEATTYPKTANSRTDTSFSLVTIDLDNDMCYVDNYGAGYDREFSVDYYSEPRLLDLDRTIATAETDALIPFDTTKCYKNIAYGTAKGYNSSCTIYSTTSDSISMKESGTGGITVGYVVEFPNTAGSYTLSFDYSGTGSARVFYKTYNSSGTLVEGSHIVNATGSGSTSYTINASGCKWLVILFGSNTSGEKEYTNVELVENS